MFVEFEFFSVLNDNKIYYEIIDTDFRIVEENKSNFLRKINYVVDRVMHHYSKRGLNVAANLALAIRKYSDPLILEYGIQVEGYSKYRKDVERYLLLG